MSLSLVLNSVNQGLQQAQDRPEPGPAREALGVVGRSAASGIGRGAISGAINLGLNGSPLSNLPTILENSRAENILGDVAGNAVGGVVGEGTSRVAEQFLPDNFIGRAGAGVIGDRVEVGVAGGARDAFRALFGAAADTPIGGAAIDGLLSKLGDKLSGLFTR